MSDFRQPDEVITRRLPKNQGKKHGKISTKYELFSAKQWALRWSPADDRFFPKPPLHSEKRKQFWETMYRVRINGRWMIREAHYTLLSRDEIMKLILGA